MTMHKILILSPLLLALGTSAWAKLPAPGDDAKAKAAETAAKTAHAGKLENYKLCQAMDRVAASYHAAAKAAGKAASAPTETPACADPGPFVPAGAGSAPTAAPAMAAATTAPASPAAPAKK